MEAPSDRFVATFAGPSIRTETVTFEKGDKTDGLQIKISFVVSPVNENVTITADRVSPESDRRNDTIYKHSLFSRDDQVIHSLNAGINAGQHEGGGKSLEIRRFGFNLDHGGVNGGIKILVDNFQQNQGTQAHGQGYLGSLKTLSPELVDEITIINGPFSALYGDFSGLGAVQIHLKDSLPHHLTARLQRGSFRTARAFVAFSPQIRNTSSVISYEGSYSDGPFKNPLRYRRDNLTGSISHKFDRSLSAGLKFNGGRNSFTSSGQIPLDQVISGTLDRFAFIDPDNGGRVRSANMGAFLRKEWVSGKTFRADVFLGRSLFDLFSNFTFFLADPVYGDEIQQHDSRLQEGGNVQYLHPYKILGHQALLTAGANLHLSQINVGLYPSIGRQPDRKTRGGNATNAAVLYTSGHAAVNNYAGYVQNGIDLADGRVHIEAGLRWDHFSFALNGFEESDMRRDLRGTEAAAKFQPKLAIVWAPFAKFPTSFYANYGRGISSQDARGVIRNPSGPKLSTTDFYQTAAAYNGKGFSFSPSFYFIDRSNEQVYIPDDGSLEFAERSRSYGVEIKASARLNRHLSVNAGLTRVFRAYYPGRFTVQPPRKRIQIDGAPRTVANGSIILSEILGINSSLSWRHISSYRLDGEDPSILASGHDVVDLSLSKRLRNWIDLNFSIDNLLNKKYFETQNYFESRLTPTDDITSRIHVTPAYPATLNIGLTFRLGAKN